VSEFDKMYKTHIEHIDKSNLIQRAYKSALYHKRWKKKGLDIDSLEGYNGLSQLPYTDASDLRETWDNHSVEDIILTEKVGFWYTTSGSMGNKKWIPWTYNDYDKAGVALAEIIMNYLTPNDRVLTVVLPPPFISGTTPFKLLENTGKMGTPLEVLAFAPDFLQDGFGLLMKRKPTALICTPSFAVRIADEIAINTPKLLEARAKQENKALLKVAAAVTKLKKIYPKNIFKEMKIGIFGGEKLDPFRKILEDKWGIEAFDAYAFTEGFSGGFECSEHNGLHFPSRNGIIEIIPEKELEKEEKDPTYQPEAIILTEAEEGLIGELVLTDFKEAMPMLRYRVHDRVKIVASEGCTCKFTSPRLKILGRTDGIINMGVIRLHHLIFDQLLLKEFKSGKVDQWEVYVTREKYKPKLILTVKPEFVKNEEEFKKELFESLHSFDLFQRGYDYELFVFDEIKLDDNLKLELYGQGKSRKVRYDPDFDKSVKI